MLRQKVCRLTVAALTAAALTGCGQKAEPEPNYGIWGDKNKNQDQGTQTLVITHLPNSALVSREEIARPPNKETYLKLSSQEKERELTRYSVSLLASLGKANYKLDSLAQWKQEMAKLNSK